MHSSLKSAQTIETDGSEQQWPSIDEILKRSNATGKEDDNITIPQIDFLLEGMRTKIAMTEAHDTAENRRLGMGYGVEVQAKVFEVAEMKVNVLRLEDRVEFMRKAEKKGRKRRILRRGWQRVIGQLEQILVIDTLRKVEDKASLTACGQKAGSKGHELRGVSSYRGGFDW